MKKTVKGELTVFLSLVFLILMSLVMAVIQSAAIQVDKNEKRVDASRAVESVFAEYHRMMMEDYGVLALDKSYATDSSADRNILNRLSYYGAENMKIRITSIRYLTDQLGSSFYEQAVKYEKEKKGMTGTDKILQYVDQWKSHKSDSNDLNEDLDHVREELEQTSDGENGELKQIREFLSEKLLKLVLPGDFQVSDKKLTLSRLPSQRERTKGYGNLAPVSKSVADSVFFNLYLTEKFGNVRNRKDRALDYEQEYLLNGKSTDKKNLEESLKKIVNFRFGINYLYLLSDETKNTEAEVAAGIVAAAILAPESEPAVKTALMLIWAYAESVMDARELVEGGKLPMDKTKGNWKLSISNLMHIKDTIDQGKPDEDTEGWDYDTYLRVLLMLRKKEVLSMRALDLIEENIRLKGEPNFRTDQMVSGAEFQMHCPLGIGISYDFNSVYQYK